MSDFITSPFFPGQRVLTAFSKKSLGNMSFVWGNRGEVACNRENYSRQVGLSGKPFINLFLNHGTRIVLATNKDAVGISSYRPSFSATDAVIVNRRGLFIFFCVADCQPLIIFDPCRKILAAAHIGWRGAVGKLHLLLPLKMITEYGCRLSDMQFGIGPSLRRKCSLQPRPVLQESLPEWDKSVKIIDNQTAMVDTLGFILSDLKDFGVKNDNLSVSPLCTVCRFDEYFSAEAVQRGLTTEKEGRFGVITGML